MQEICLLRIGLFRIILIHVELSNLYSFDDSESIDETRDSQFNSNKTNIERTSFVILFLSYLGKTAFYDI